MKFFAQQESKDCGPTCLKMILKYYGKNVSIDNITEFCNTNIQGTSINNLINGAQKMRLEASAKKIEIDDLKEIDFPVILYVNDNHYIIVYGYKKNKFFVADPAIGKLKVDAAKLRLYWLSSSSKGIAIMLSPTTDFEALEESKENYKAIFSEIKTILTKYKFLHFQIILGVILIGALQLVFPFLSQQIVDKGIGDKSTYLVGIILINQFLIFSGRSITEFIQAKIMLHVSSRLSISLVSNFFIQLMRLPISFFDVKSSGDIHLRIADHRRIEIFLMTHLIDFILAVLTFFVLAGILLYYSYLIFFIFLIGSIIHFLWIVSFMKRRKILDYARFEVQAKESSLVHELVGGMQELKLYNAQWERKKKWEEVKIKLYENVEKTFALTQAQFIGGKVISEIKNIAINGVAAFSVISGDISLGVMFAIMFMTGQLNMPIQTFVSFALGYQDAFLAMQRISSIYNKEKEDSFGDKKIDFQNEIILKDVSFKYVGENKNVLHNINLTIQKGKKIALVGRSGSGKTTLVKLLLKFYKPDKGSILIDETDLQEINDIHWREKCGSVMQDGYIFNDTILKNITLRDNHDLERLTQACKVANIENEINSLPLGINTVIGFEGRGLSKGQIQRLIIARAIYQAPQIFFFDEATSALDTENEKIITQNLNTFLTNKTTIVVAHRLSTVVDADLIIVMENGEIVETGTHKELISKKAHYANLVRNQMDINYSN
jgi:ATP-binding cassette subfamily B protein